MKTIVSKLKTQAAGLALGALLVATSAASVAGAALGYAGDGSVEATAVGIGGLKIVAKLVKGKTPTVSEKDGAIEVKLPWDSLTTDMSLRDGHMREKFHAQQHKQIIVSVKRADLKFPEDGKESVGTATGQVNINGVSKAYPISYKATRTGSDYHVKAHFVVKITDFKLELPCFAGQCVDDAVDLKVKIKLRDS